MPNRSPFTQHAVTLINTDEIINEELDLAIKQLKQNKAPGPDGIIAEFYKWLDPLNRNHLLDTMNECWNNGSLHKTMNEANLAIIKKKENPSYRRITDL